MAARAGVVAATVILALAGCARPDRRVTPTLAEMLPQFQVACASRGDPPGSAAYERCVADRTAAWRAANGVPNTAGPAAGTKPAASAAPTCRPSPLGGYDCGRRLD